MSILLYSIILLASSVCHGFDGKYIYPRLWFGSEDNPKIYLIHQTIDQQLELWVWDKQQNKFFKGLPSYFNPSYLTILPDKKGISFLDQGRIRIKCFGKRSVKSIDIDYPVYDIYSFAWIDNHALYICAKEQGHYAIFHLTIDGELEPIVRDAFCDLLYPQKIGNSLFFIQRTSQGRCSLMHVDYPYIPYNQNNNFNAVDTFDERVTSLFKKNNKYQSSSNTKNLIDFGMNFIVHLSMISGKSGFVIQYDGYDQAEEIFCFDCLYIEMNDNQWRQQKIFSFKLPRYLIDNDSEHRLIESLSLLLPSLIDKKIYFVDLYKGVLVLFSYELETFIIKKEYAHEDYTRHSFFPLLIGDTLICGGSLF